LDQVNPVLAQSSRDFSDAMQQMIIEAERAMFSIQDSVPVSIRDYSSLTGKGQGLVDDREIVLRAIRAVGNNGGGYLFLPRGDYFFEGSIAHSFDNVVLIGEGENTVIHQLTTNTVTFEIGNSASTTTGVGFRDFVIDNDIGGVASIQLRLQRCQRSFLDRVTLLGTYATGFVISGGDGINVTNCTSLLASLGGDFSTQTSAGQDPSNVLVMHNDFEEYNYAATGNGSTVIRDNTPIATPTITINGLAQTITDNQVFDAPHRFIRVTGTNGSALLDQVDTVEATYEGDLRTFLFTTGNPVTFLDIPTGGVNLHLAGDFVADGVGNQDSLTLFCGGTNWIEVARSLN
jgi:hypothetical protein